MNTVHIEQVITNGKTDGWIVVWDANPGSRETATKYYNFRAALDLCDKLNGQATSFVEYVRVYP